MKFPLLKSISENAVTIQFGDSIDVHTNEAVLGFHHFLQEKNFTGFVESVPAYTTLTVVFDPVIIAGFNSYRSKTISTLVTEELTRLLEKAVGYNPPAIDEISVPVCYEDDYAPDMNEVAAYCKMSKEKIIELHSSVSYRVFFIGFVPGFPYLGINPGSLIVPRKKTPALSVVAGSVAIAGQQSGIYPFNTPGGWQVIGRTPMKIFDAQKTPCTKFSPGQIIRFNPITSSEFLEISGS